jgi:hypothetical protein
MKNWTKLLAAVVVSTALASIVVGFALANSPAGKEIHRG